MLCGCVVMYCLVQVTQAVVLLRPLLFRQSSTGVMALQQALEGPAALTGFVCSDVIDKPHDRYQGVRKVATASQQLLVSRSCEELQ